MSTHFSPVTTPSQFICLFHWGEKHFFTRVHLSIGQCIKIWPTALQIRLKQIYAIPKSPLIQQYMLQSCLISDCRGRPVHVIGLQSGETRTDVFEFC